MPLTERELGLYYHGFCNRALWPLFHDFPGEAIFSPEDLASYERVIRRFAEATLEHAGGAERRIDFFLHIPFPPPVILRALPWRDEILQGVLAADGASCHVPLYRDNVVRCARHFASVDDAGPDAAGRINAEHGREGWMPIHYRYTALDRKDLVARYLAADVALVTPLRDGMNLVASEFAAARTDDGAGPASVQLNSYSGSVKSSCSERAQNGFASNGSENA